ncbi:M48 family metallopeptidase [Sphingorhabdus sp. Alg239-R122]|uniref:M48 family metallopeptidase n=1 Tax=Sphingorhabdus sp. Alg239-R122 TaxID=2305989 RepID=UPI0013D9B492|nr:M48 family metallopeptidase [Sphingorhabdus sp. Alg239-R122]
MAQPYTTWFYDGRSAVRRHVVIDTAGGQFHLVESGHLHGPFAFSRLVYSGQQGDAHVYKHDEIDGWRMGLEGDIPVALESVLPSQNRYGSWVDRLGLGRAALVFGLLSAGAMAIILAAPQWLAPLVPTSAEKKLGDALVGDFGGRFCNTEAGQAALAKLSSGLDKDVSDLDIEVANIDMVNAVALPGGKIILFNGLLDNAESADEVAGVLAHEMGHVRKRHVMQSLIRQMGLSVLMGGFDGNIGGTLNGLLSMGYSRSAESEADRHAIQALQRADISPLATAGFFERLANMESMDSVESPQTGDSDQPETEKSSQTGSAASDTESFNEAETLLGYLSSHPLSKSRKTAFEKSHVKDREYTPALTQDEWDALREMCANDADVESGFGFDFGSGDSGNSR